MFTPKFFFGRRGEGFSEVKPDDDFVRIKNGETLLATGSVKRAELGWQGEAHVEESHNVYVENLTTQPPRRMRARLQTSDSIVIVRFPDGNRAMAKSVPEEPESQ